MTTKIKIYTALTVFGISTLLFASEVSAHGFGERYDLPIPLSYFLIGSALAVALSFAVIGWFIRSSSNNSEYPRFNIYRFFVIELVCKMTSKILGLISVLILFLSIHTGLIGTSNAIENFENKGFSSDCLVLSDILPFNFSIVEN